MYSIVILVSDNVIRVFENDDSHSFVLLHLKGEPSIVIGGKNPESVLREVGHEILSALNEGDFAGCRIAVVYDSHARSMLNTLWEVFQSCVTWEVRALESFQTNPEIILGDEDILRVLTTRHGSAKDKLNEDKIKELSRQIQQLQGSLDRASTCEQAYEQVAKNEKKLKRELIDHQNLNRIACMALEALLDHTLVVRRASNPDCRDTWSFRKPAFSSSWEQEELLVVLLNYMRQYTESDFSPETYCKMLLPLINRSKLTPKIKASLEHAWKESLKIQVFTGHTHPETEESSPSNPCLGLFYKGK